VAWLWRWLGYPSVQIALCVAVFGVVAWRMGPFATVVASPLLAAAIARPVLSLLANFRHVLVLEDDDRCRWISLADVKKIAGVTASEGALVVTYPERCKRMGKGEHPHMRDDALVEHLAKESNAVALRFRTWVERTVWFPGRKIRKSLGIRPEPPDAD
jgi:hypothetical protein